MKLSSLWIIGVMAISSPLAWGQTETPLLPEVKQILEQSTAVDKKSLEQNGYVALLAIDAPADVDYQAIGKKVILANANKIKQALAQQNHQLVERMVQPADYYANKAALSIDRNIKGKDYIFPCDKLANLQCTAQLLTEQAELEQLIKRNKLLLARYQQIIKMPTYNNPFFIYTSPLPPYQISLYLSKLRLSEAVLAINQGHVETGLTILQEEVSFAKRILLGKTFLIDQMIAIRQLYNSYHVIGELLDSSHLAKELSNPQLVELLKPLSEQEQQVIANAIVYERNLALIWLAMQGKPMILSALRQVYIGEFSEKDTSLTYDKNATLNGYYQEFSPLIAKARLTLPKAAENLQHKSLTKVVTLWAIYKKYSKDNVVGGLFLEKQSSYLEDYDRYMIRLYDLNSYLTLINVKLQIKQQIIARRFQKPPARAILKPYLTKADVPALLKQLGDKAINPYSKQPFVWHADNQTLTTDWLELQGIDGDQAIVKIEFNH